MKPSKALAKAKDAKQIFIVCGAHDHPKGINDINISASDIERSFSFYKDILGFKPLFKSEGSAYFLAGNPDDPRCLWFSLGLHRNGLPRPSPCNTHFAFSVDDKDFEHLSKSITQFIPIQF